jgi:hypothetical protein
MNDRIRGNKMTDSNNNNIINFPGSSSVSGALQLRVELLLMPLPVWRRILVPGQYSFWDLHVAIQDSMGWEDRHLHQFTLDDPVTGERVRLGIPDDSGFYGVSEVLPGWEHRVSRFMKPDALPSLYTYDFGDEWQHEVILETTLPSKATLVLPHCQEGEGRCPAEDSGGPAACQELLDSDLGNDFDPTAVSFDDPRARWTRAFRND